MKKLALAAVAAIALMLGGCGAGGGQFNPITSIENIYGAATGSAVTPQAVYDLSNAFDVAVGMAKGYDMLPLCGTQKGYACRQMPIVKQVDSLVRQGIIVRDEMIAYVLANPGKLSPVSNYNTLKTLISAITSYTKSSQPVAAPSAP